MKLLFTKIFFCVLITLNSFGQTKDASQSLKQDANKMSAAFLASDYTTFAKYTYPAILQMMGGTNNMSEVLSKTTANMKAQGMSFSNITFGEPSAIVKSGNELQCTIPQHTEIKLSAGGRIIATSTLIAISTDNGKSWTFIDTSNKDMATLHKALPNLSSAITIPPPQPPVRYNN
ncbi:MAG: hypothetical protein JST21_18705 [Bacteroidetes bacterium]|nr:hypothetical protein [Bacteroidota bacterium]